MSKAMKQSVKEKKKSNAANVPFAFRYYSPEELREVLRKMYLIRRFEEGAEDSYTRGLIHGTMHLSIGQEASALGICMPLTDDYQIVFGINRHARRTRHGWR